MAKPAEREPQASGTAPRRRKSMRRWMRRGNTWSVFISVDFCIKRGVRGGGVLRGWGGEGVGRVWGGCRLGGIV